MTAISEIPITDKFVDSSEVTRVRLPLEGGIRLDGDTQARVALYQIIVDEYADAISARSQLPPVIINTSMVACVSGAAASR
jgi:hypothetical protein